MVKQQKLHRPAARQRGIVLLVVMMLVFIITGASIATLYTVKASIKGTGYLRERLERTYLANGGWQAVYGYMCARGLTQEDVDFRPELRHDDLSYEVQITDVRTVKRRIPGYSGELLGRDIVLESSAVLDSPSGVGSNSSTNVLVFIGQAYVSGGYGNE
jgi:hypothetical protein